jgi:hypothetical protein
VRMPNGVMMLFVKKSQATSVFTCSRMNFCHTVSSALLRRVGDGVRPSSFRIRRTDDRPSFSRSLRSSPTMRRYPQFPFSFARRITISRMLRTIFGRPTRFGRRPSLISITQREYVFGVTMPMMSADVVIEFPADGQQPGPVFGAGDDAIAAQLAAEDLDLGLQEPDAGITAGGHSLTRRCRRT